MTTEEQVTVLVETCPAAHAYIGNKSDGGSYIMVFFSGDKSGALDSDFHNCIMQLYLIAENPDTPLSIREKHNRKGSGCVYYLNGDLTFTEEQKGKLSWK